MTQCSGQCHSRRQSTDLQMYSPSSNTRRR